MKLCLNCRTTFESTAWVCPHCGDKPEINAGFPSFAPRLSSDAGFKDAYFHELVNLESRNFWFRARNQLIIWALGHYFPNSENFLEIGCGTGFVLSGLEKACPNKKLSGCEISSIGLKYASERIPAADFFQMDARAIPFVDEFDVVGAFDVLEHIEQDEQVLRQMYQAIRVSGGIILTVPQHNFLWSVADEHACHIRRYSSSDLLKKVIACGFSVERLTSFVSLLLPLMMISRMRKPATSNEYDPLAELRMNGTLNSSFEQIMKFESLAIRSGFNFWAGGSLLLIARKKH